jgi:hypothetical protein
MTPDQFSNGQRINELKIALFDIIREQTSHQLRIQQLEQVKADKLKELAAAEQQSKSDVTHYASQP